jgi:hypothetical protein
MAKLAASPTAPGSFPTPIVGAGSAAQEESVFAEVLLSPEIFVPRAECHATHFILRAAFN